MKLKQIYDYLDSISPFELQEKWDNSGLLVGGFEDEVNNVYISIDLDEEVLNSMEDNSLIITHHPLIFSALKKINYDSYSTKLLRILIKKNIALIAMHTNIDVTHLNKYVANNVLGLDVISSEDYICYANVNDSFSNFANNISSRLGLKYLKYVKCSQSVKKVALVTGAGMSMISNVKADCFITGDIKYHDAMEAKARGISLIDIRHYESEKHFSPLVEGLLSEYLKKNKLKAIITSSKNPFTFCTQGETVE
ncbi:MAG: Nif3-like dinuclear metal center hexameric protein [Arcobacter sp.]|nr:Nif3-like dinuclear metal center hexameric protein [Arcobacter sp.]